MLLLSALPWMSFGNILSTGVSGEYFLILLTWTTKVYCQNVIFFRIFVGFQWVLIFTQFILQVIVPDVPEDVEIQEQRIKFFHAKIIDRVEDEDFADEDTQEKEELTANQNCCLAAMGFRGTGLLRKMHGSHKPTIPYEAFPGKDQAEATWPNALDGNDPRLVSGRPSTTTSQPSVSQVSNDAPLPPPPVQITYASAYGAIPPPAPTNNYV
jgi:hypothetical protein